MRKDAAIETIAWSPDGQRFATWCGGTCNGREGEPRTQVLVWSVPDLQIRAAIEPNKDDRDDGRVYAVDFSPDGSRIVASTQNEVSLWSAADGSLVARVATPRGYGSFEFSPDGRFLRAGDAAGGLVVVESATGRVVLSDRLGGSAPSQAARWTRDGKRLFVEASSSLGVWQADAGRDKLTRVESLGNLIGTLDLSRDDRFVYLGAPEVCSGLLLSVDPPKVVRRFPSESVCLARFSPAKDELAQLNRDGSVTILPLGKGARRVIRRSPGRDDSAPSEKDIAYSPDGERLFWKILGHAEVARVADGTPLAAPAAPVGLASWDSDTEIARFREDGRREVFDVEKGAIVPDDEPATMIPTTPYDALRSIARGDLHLLRDDGEELIVRAAFVKEPGEPRGVWRVAIVDPKGHAGGDDSLVATDVYDAANGAKAPVRVEADLASRFFAPIITKGLVPKPKPTS